MINSRIQFYGIGFKLKYNIASQENNGVSPHNTEKCRKLFHALLVYYFQQRNVSSSFCVKLQDDFPPITSAPNNSCIPSFQLVISVFQISIFPHSSVLHGCNNTAKVVYLCTSIYCSRRQDVLPQAYTYSDLCSANTEVPNSIVLPLRLFRLDTR